MENIDIDSIINTSEKMDIVQHYLKSSNPNMERRIIKKETINSETEKPHVNLTKASIKVEIQIKINKEISGNNSTSFNGIRM